VQSNNTGKKWRLARKKTGSYSFWGYLRWNVLKGRKSYTERGGHEKEKRVLLAMTLAFVWILQVGKTVT